MARQKAAFDRCVEAARSEPGGEALAGRKIALLVAVGNGGRVEASEVEEPDVEASPLGSCLRRVAGRLLFPPFEGEPVGLRIPLQLGTRPATGRPGPDPGVAGSGSRRTRAAAAARRRALSHSKRPGRSESTTTTTITFSMCWISSGKRLPSPKPISVIEATQAVPPITLKEAKRR